MLQLPSSAAIKLVAISLGPGALIPVLYCGIIGVNIYLFPEYCGGIAECDWIGLYIWLTGILAVLTSVGCSMAAALSAKCVYQLSARNLIFVIFGIGILLVSALFAKGDWPYRILDLALYWVLFSGAMCWGGIRVAHQLQLVLHK